jgi:hypothetical protein
MATQITRLTKQGNYYFNNGTIDETSGILQVTNGLQLHLDAAIPESYPGTGTTWYDLSPNKFNGTLTSDYNGNGTVPVFSPMKNNSFYFGGMAPGGSTSSPVGWPYHSVEFTNVTPNTLGIYQHDFTVSSWVLCQNPQLGQPGAILCSFNGTNVAGGQYTISWFYNYLLTGMYGSSNYSYTDNGNVWENVVDSYTYNGSISVSNVYVNGVLVYSQTNIGYMTPPVQNSNLRIGVGNLGGGYFQGYIGNFLIYNRALSAAEVASNFNATRKRFGV